MSIFKCKMCGGTIEFAEGATVGVCDSCGTKQTLPRIDDDKKANLYDRANHFRRNNEFDKAAAIYEQILNEDTTDAEAYWSLVLCQYGIEYVEDPATHKRVPTVNRAQFTSIFDDDNYKSAIEYADSMQKELYEKEAKVINDIQKGILAISQKEEPFDVFICYKEMDNNGRRTPDSVLANELYHQLVEEGFKVFFARITLEDKLGTAYEPYIFAALQSSKVMVVLGTRPEYFNAVWVKNEWSRYLTLVKKSGGKKILIPAYRDMDPYDLPEEFSHLQAQDMSKLGFMQDLIRGIRKIVTNNDRQLIRDESPDYGGANANSLIERAYIFIEDREWDNANEYLERALDINPKNAEAYLGKLLVELHVASKEDLNNCENSFENSNNYQKAVKYANSSLKNELLIYIDNINKRNKEKILENDYVKAYSIMDSADDETDYKNAADLFKTLGNYKDANEKYEYSLLQSEICKQEDIYTKACALLDSRMLNLSRRIRSFEKALDMFASIIKYKDSEDKLSCCKSQIVELKKKFELRQKRIKRLIVVTASSMAVIIVLSIIVHKVIVPEYKYNTAISEYEAGNYQKALSIFTEIKGYKDSVDKALDSQYTLALQQYEEKQYAESYSNYSAIKNYKDANDKIIEVGLAWINELIEKKEYKKAEEVLKPYWKSTSFDAVRTDLFYKEAEDYYNSGDYARAYEYHTNPISQDGSDSLFNDICYYYGKDLMSNYNYARAIEVFRRCEKYKDTDELIKLAKYKFALVNYNANGSFNRQKAHEYLKELKELNYKDTKQLFKEFYAWKADIIANDKEDDGVTSLSSISKFKKWCFHITLKGGEPGASTKIKFTGIYPNGSKSPGSFDWDCFEGGGGTVWWYYNKPAYGKQGKFTLIVYDEKGNVIGKKTIDITS